MTIDTDFTIDYTNKRIWNKYALGQGGTATVYSVNALVLEHVLERNKVSGVITTVPDWISNNPDIDSSVWSKKKNRITLTARVDDFTMSKLIKMKGGLAQIYDGYNTYTAFIVNTEGIWTTDPNYPWTATIDFIVLLSDET